MDKTRRRWATPDRLGRPELESDSQKRLSIDPLGCAELTPVAATNGKTLERNRAATLLKTSGRNDSLLSVNNVTGAGRIVTTERGDRVFETRRSHDL